MKKPPSLPLSSSSRPWPSQHQHQHYDGQSTTLTPPQSQWTALRRLSLVALLLMAVTVAPAKLACFWQPQSTTESASLSSTAKMSGFHLRSSAVKDDTMVGSMVDALLIDNARWLQESNASVTAESAGTSGNAATEAPVFDEEFCNAECPYVEPETWVSAVPFAIQIIMIIVLILMSALFSGLTLGLMGLDKTGLEIVMESEDPVAAANARIIYPVRKNGNQLLCTLLLGNVAVNALLSILLADKAGGAVGFISSTFLIVIFGEIIPQAACSRYALKIGSKTVPLVKVIMVLVYPIAKPLAFCLDKALGRELATTYSNAEMLAMLKIHVQEDMLDKETADAMTGALKYKDMTVGEVMTPLKNTFMISVDEKLSFETIAKIFKTGYSRIPIYEVSQNNIIGLLFVKDLIFIDPADESPIRNFVQIFGRNVHYTWPDEKLGDVLRELRLGKSHLSLVRDVVSDGDKDPVYEVKGIITLEDIIEEIIGHEIVDETDAFVDGTHEVKVNRAEGFEWAKLRLLGSRMVDEKLSYTETKAITAHLLANYPKAVALLTENQVLRLVADTPVTVLPTATRELGKELPNDLLYEKNAPSDVCSLILSGKVTVIAGEDEIRTDVSSWTLLGIGALRDPQYKPDFTAFVCSGPCKILRLTRRDFEFALDASASEKRSIREDSFRSLATDPQKVSGPSSLGASSQQASEYSDGNDNGDALKVDRKSKLIAALQMASGPDAPITNNSLSMLDAVGVSTGALDIPGNANKNGTATSVGSGEAKARVSFVGTADEDKKHSNHDPKESAMEADAEGTSETEASKKNDVID